MGHRAGGPEAGNSRPGGPERLGDERYATLNGPCSRHTRNAGVLLVSGEQFVRNKPNLFWRARGVPGKGIGGDARSCASTNRSGVRNKANSGGAWPLESRGCDAKQSQFGCRAGDRRGAIARDRRVKQSQSVAGHMNCNCCLGRELWKTARVTPLQKQSQFRGRGPGGLRFAECGLKDGRALVRNKANSAQ